MNAHSSRTEPSAPADAPSSREDMCSYTIRQRKDEENHSSDEKPRVDETDEDDDHLHADEEAPVVADRRVVCDDLQMDARRLKMDFSNFRPRKDPNDTLKEEEFQESE